MSADQTAMRDFSIRTMSREEIAIAIDWARAEGWNPGLYDADAFFAADSGAFLVGLRDGAAVATISATAYGDAFGFIGFYIVRPDCRGHGYGFKIWQAAMARLAGRNIGLDGVIAQQANYMKSGFQFAHRNVRYQGVARKRESKALPGDIRIIGPCRFVDVADYDRAFFPAPRENFLKAWLTQPHSVALGVERRGVFAGYGVLRACHTGYKIGPLFADDPALAGCLLAALVAEAPAGAPFFLDAPQCNGAAVALAERFQLKPVFETARMYTGPAPDISLDRTYGVTSFEFG